MFVTEQESKGRKSKKSKNTPQSPSLDSHSIGNAEFDGKALDEESPSQEQEKESLVGSLRSSSRSIEYGEFHKVAAELLGGDTEYKKGFDIHTSYKALKKAI